MFQFYFSFPFTLIFTLFLNVIYVYLSCTFNFFSLKKSRARNGVDGETFCFERNNLGSRTFWFCWCGATYHVSTTRTFQQKINSPHREKSFVGQGVLADMNLWRLYINKHTMHCNGAFIGLVVHRCIKWKSKLAHALWIGGGVSCNFLVLFCFAEIWSWWRSNILEFVISWNRSTGSREEGEINLDQHHRSHHYNHDHQRHYNHHRHHHHHHHRSRWAGRERESLSWQTKAFPTNLSDNLKSK